MKIPITSYRFLLFFAVIFSSCSTDMKIGKGNYFGKNCKIIRGQLGGLNYVMLVTQGKNKYPFTIDFRRDMKPFFAHKTTVFANKFITWHGVTDTTKNLFRSFGTILVGGATLGKRSFIPISEEEKIILYNVSDILSQKQSNLTIPKDSISRLIGWVKVNE